VADPAIEVRGDDYDVYIPCVNALVSVNETETAKKMRNTRSNWFWKMSARASFSRTGPIHYQIPLRDFQPLETDFFHNILLGIHSLCTVRDVFALAGNSQSATVSKSSPSNISQSARSGSRRSETLPA